MSLNQLFISFMAYLSFFIYGYSVTPFNHYIIWPRLIAAFIVAWILIEIWQDRRNRISMYVAFIAATCLILSVFGAWVGQIIYDESRTFATCLILIISVLIVQGYCHQFLLIIRSGQTGAVDIRMSQFIFVMDISTIAFAFSMGINQGWPLLILATTSAVTKIIMMYLFNWVKHSKTAKQRQKLLIKNS